MHIFIDSSTAASKGKARKNSKRHELASNKSIAGVITLEDVLEDVLEEILGKEMVDELDEVEDMRDLAQQRREKLMKRNFKSNS